MNQPANYRERSALTLRQVEENDPNLTVLTVLHFYDMDANKSGYFHPENRAELTRLGNALRNNTHLNFLCVSTINGHMSYLLDNNEALFEGLRQNTFIDHLGLTDCDLSIDTERELVIKFATNISNIRAILAKRCTLLRGGARALASVASKSPTLSSMGFKQCNVEDGILRELLQLTEGSSEDPNVNILALIECNIDDGILEKLVRETPQLNGLDALGFEYNNIGKAGFQVIATKLLHPNCNIRRLLLRGNNIDIDDECATTLAKALRGNNKFCALSLQDNQITVTESGWLGFYLTLSYYSNHTLNNIDCEDIPDKLSSLLQLNKGSDKELVSRQKVLPELDMEPLFEWDMEGERNLKALPFVISWFGRVREYNQSNVDVANEVDARKLSAIYQFARAMPLLLVPTTTNMATGGKRKIDEVG